MKSETQSVEQYYRYCPDAPQVHISDSVCFGRQRVAYPPCKDCQFNYANQERQPGMEFFVADALRMETLRRGGAKLTDDVGAADVVVTGRVVDLTTRPRTFSSVVLALEYEVTLDLELSAERRGDEGRVLDGFRLSESERYLSSADNQAERKNREEALRRVSRVLAARAIDALAEGLR